MPKSNWTFNNLSNNGVIGYTEIKRVDSPSDRRSILLHYLCCKFSVFEKKFKVVARFSTKA